MELGASRRALSREGSARDSEPRETGESASRGGERAGLVDATSYDFERLERAVGQLIEQQRLLLLENESLREKLRDRGQQVEQLEAELAESNGRREKAMERLDALIAELEVLDDRLERSLEARGESPANLGSPTPAVD